MQRLVTLPPAPESARQARRFVADVLTAAGARQFLDVAQLLTSELVTNGIVHAHTELRLVVDATKDWVRVEVIDGNPMLPARRDYTADALTGRGLEMAELLADELGMQQLEGDGKRVWFRLGGTPADLADADADDATQGAQATEPADAPAAEDAATIRLLHLPVTLYNAWQEHADAILREATLVSLDRNHGELPEEFALAGQALSTLAAGVSGVLDQRDTGHTHVDVAIAIPRSCVPNFPVLRDLLRRCSEMAASGDLLVPGSLPEIQAVRRWVCDEVGRQGQGLPPRPWAELVVEDVPVDPMSADAVEEVRAAPAAVLAADRWNRIIAASPAAGELLGWDAGDLEGRRLVTIIPPALRDRHIAGFTRQMLGGESRILGRAVELPALRRDGTEIAVTLLIERRSDTRGRALFVATLEAVPGDRR